jgi:hypothetical protein
MIIIGKRLQRASWIRFLRTNLEHENELQHKDNKYFDLYEENNVMHEGMLEL